MFTLKMFRIKTIWHIPDEKNKKYLQRVVKITIKGYIIGIYLWIYQYGGYMIHISFVWFFFDESTIIIT